MSRGSVCGIRLSRRFSFLVSPSRSVRLHRLRARSILFFTALHSGLVFLFAPRLIIFFGFSMDVSGLFGTGLAIRGLSVPPWGMPILLATLRSGFPGILMGAFGHV